MSSFSNLSGLVPEIKFLEGGLIWMDDVDNDHGKIQEQKYRSKEPTQKVEGTVILF